MPGLCFLGVPVDDPELDSLMSRVVWLSIGSAMIILAEGVFSSFASGNMGFVFVAVFTLMIPACGHLGVLQKSRDYLCCFCGWSFVCFVIGLVNLMLIAIVVGGGFGDSPTYVWVMHIVFSVLSTFVYFLSFHYGKTLHQNEHFESGPGTDPLLRLEMSLVMASGGRARQGGRGTAMPPLLTTGVVSMPSQLTVEHQAVMEEPQNQPMIDVLVVGQEEGARDADRVRPDSPPQSGCHGHAQVL